MASSERIDRARAKMAALKPHLVGKVQTAERGQLLLFPGHMVQSAIHAWRFIGTDRRFKGRHFVCSICSVLMIKIGEASVYGVSRSTDEPPCKVSG